MGLENILEQVAYNFYYEQSYNYEIINDNNDNNYKFENNMPDLFRITKDL